MLMFVEFYLQTHNGVEAAKRAGYKGNDVTLGAVAYENLNKPQIKALIASRMAPVIKSAKMSADRVIEELSDIAGSDWRDHLQIKMKDGVIIDAQLKLGDKVKALELVGKYHGIWQEDRKHDEEERRITCLRLYKHLTTFAIEGVLLTEDQVIEGMETTFPNWRELIPEAIGAG